MNKVIISVSVLLVFCLFASFFAYDATDSEAIVSGSESVAFFDSDEFANESLSLPFDDVKPISPSTKSPAKTPKPTPFELSTAIPALTSNSYVKPPKVKKTSSPLPEAPVSDVDDTNSLGNEDDNSDSIAEETALPTRKPKPTPKDVSGISYRCVMTNQPHTFVVKWNKVTDASEYQVQLSNYESITEHTRRNASVDTPEINITNVDDSLDYYVRVRVVYSDGTKGSWSNVLNLRHPFV